MGPGRSVFLLMLVAACLPTTASLAAQGAVVYVDDDASGSDDGTSWADAFTSLQSALDMVRAGDEVWVATGTYVTGTSSTATFALVDGVALYGGFAGDEQTLEQRAGLYLRTVLSGTPAPGASEHVVSAIDAGPTTRLDGFRIRNGLSFGSTGGAGLLIVGGAPRIENCALDDLRREGPSQTAVTGGAVFIDGGDPLFVACDFRNNVASGHWSGGFEPGGDALGGAVCNLDGQPTFVLCRFLGNRAEGGEALKIGPAGGAFGGAIFTEGGLLTLAHCVLNGNNAGGGTFLGLPEGESDGGGLYCAGAAMIIQSSFSGNVAGVPLPFPSFQSGVGGALAVAATVDVVQCTFSANAAKTAGGVHLFSGQLRIANSILWGHGPAEADQLHAAPGAALQVSHSCIQGLTGALGGAGNIGADPLFVSPAGLDGVVGTVDDGLLLSPGSACIDAGDNAAVPDDDFDFDGDGQTAEAVPVDLSFRSRFSDDPLTPDTGSGIKPVVDIGSFEHQADQCQTDLGFQGPGEMALSVCGQVLTASGSSALCSITGVPSAGPVALFVGVVFAPTPFRSGTLVPTPPLLTVIVGSAGGVVSFPVAGAAGPPVNVYLQAAAKGPEGLEFSNALEVVIGS
jgi:hypothetical protein